eukprot:COSAG01_NODE_1751_length_9323_cov_5.197507_6_plen_93_part_00
MCISMEGTDSPAWPGDATTRRERRQADNEAERRGAAVSCRRCSSQRVSAVSTQRSSTHAHPALPCEYDCAYYSSRYRYLARYRYRTGTRSYS